MNSSTHVERFLRSVVARPWQILAGAMLLTALSSWGISELDIFTSRKAMLPKRAEVSIRLERFLEQFGAASDLIVVVEGASRPDMEAFASELARRLAREKEVHSATERVDRLFYLEHAYLLIPPHVLDRAVSVIDQLVGVPATEQLADWQDAWKRTDAWLNDASGFSSVDMDLRTAEESLHLVLFLTEEWLRWIDAPQAPLSLAWNKLLARHGAESLASGYFSSRDGNMLFLFVRPSETSEEFAQVQPFIDTVRRIGSELREQWLDEGRKPPTVGLTGLPAATYEEFTAVKRDIVFTVSTAAALIILLILLWLRSLRWAIIVFAPMALGVVWNLGLTYLLVGHLTMITSGFTAILFGLGVDYGIFMSTRIIEERRTHKELAGSIARGGAASAKALMTAGTATVLIFASLALVEFDGFAELGVVAACGVGLVLLGTFVIQPVLFTLLPPGGGAERARPRLQQPARAERLKISRSLSVLLVLVALTGAVAGGSSVFSIPFDYDVMSLLPEGSEAARYQRRMLLESDFQGEVVIGTADGIEQARQLAQRMAALPAVARVQSITDLFPPDATQRVTRARRIGRLVDESEYARQIRGLGEIQLTQTDEERIEQTLEKIQELIERAQEQAFSAGHVRLVKLMEQLLESLESVRQRRETSPGRANERTRLYVQSLVAASKSALDVLKAWKDAKVLTPADLPQALRERFFAADGTVAFYAFPAGNVYDPEALRNLMEQVYSVCPNATGFPTTHHVFSRMVFDSFRQGSLSAIGIAILWIALFLRRLRGLVIASLPLLVGGGWMMGVMAISEMEFNFANIIGLPLVMGLAVDYGVWFAHREREHADRTGWQVAWLAGRAILLAAGTTLAGLGAITLASYRGVSSMGLAITIGLVCCVSAALLVSPAIAELMSGRKP